MPSTKTAPKSKAAVKPRKPKLERGRVLLSRKAAGMKSLGKDCTFYGALALCDDGYLVHRQTGRVLRPLGQDVRYSEAFVEHVNTRMAKHWPALEKLPFGAHWPDAARDDLAKAIASFKG